MSVPTQRLWIDPITPRFYLAPVDLAATAPSGEGGSIWIIGSEDGRSQRITPAQWAVYEIPITQAQAYYREQLQGHLQRFIPQADEIFRQVGERYPQLQALMQRMLDEDRPKLEEDEALSLLLGQPIEVLRRDPDAAQEQLELLQQQLKDEERALKDQTSVTAIFERLRAQQRAVRTGQAVNAPPSIWQAFEALIGPEWHELGASAPQYTFEQLEQLFTLMDAELAEDPLGAEFRAQRSERIRQEVMDNLTQNSSWQPPGAALADIFKRPRR